MTKSFALFVLSLLFIASVHADDFQIDPDHSRVAFKVKHLAISTVLGQFDSFSGSFSFDPNNLASSKAEAAIQAKSVNTKVTKRDDHLRSGDFLNAERFPDIKFVSNKIEGTSPENFKILGDLTIRGVTRPVTLEASFGGAAKDPWGNDRAAFVATSSISRKDFGLTWNKLLETGALVVGDEVKIELEVEGIKKKAQ